MKNITIYEFSNEMRIAFNKGKTIRIKNKDAYGNESEVHIVPTSGSNEYRDAIDGNLITKKVVA